MNSPVREWLRRAAREAGSPEELRKLGEAMVSQYPRRLVLNFAQEWEANYKVLLTPHWSSTKKETKVNPLDHIP